MSISKGVYDLHKGGSKDAARHHEKLREAFREKLHDIISEESIITESKGKKVRVPIRALDSYRFIFDPKKEKHVGQGGGDTKEGDIIAKDGDEGDGKDGGRKAGDEEGAEYYEAEIDLEDLIEMMLEDLALPNLDPKKKDNIKATEVRYDDIRKKGAMSNLDKKRSLLENVKRNAAKGHAKVGNLTQDDLRFHTWRDHLCPVTSAVVIPMIDVSASMTKEKKYLARSFFFWMVNFLRHKYEDVEIEFISHTTEARICTEDEFFHKGESGGTKCSSAYKLALETIDLKYPVNEWNIFAFHFSDGDTYSDEDECVNYAKQLAKVCNMVGYAEINTGGQLWSNNTLFDNYNKEMTEPNFMAHRISGKDDVWPCLKAFFAESIED